MQITTEQFNSLRLNSYFWDGPLPTDWVGNETQFIIHKDEFTFEDHESLSLDTKEYVRVVASLKRNAFIALETFLFHYYTKSIYLKIYDDCEYAPRISASAEIWKVVSHPTIQIPCKRTRISQKLGFYALFQCTWDPEHGFAVEHDPEFVPTTVLDPVHCWS